MANLTNLLPPERIRAQRQEYFIRLATVALLAASAVAIGSGALLMPSYLYVQKEVELRKEHVAQLDQKLEALNAKSANAQLATLAATSAYLARQASTTQATAALRTVLSVPRTGIKLSDIGYTPALHKNDGKMVLTGTAATRNALRTYVDSLSALPYVSNADLPISAYAKESDISFSITLTGTLTP